MPDIEAKNLSLSYSSRSGSVSVLSSLSALFPDKKVSVILGESGAGKTTLLKCLMGLLPYEGAVSYGGRDVTNVAPRERNVSFVSQEYALYPNLTVFENIAFPLQVMGAPREEIESRVKSLSAQLGLSFLLSRKPKALSGGQQQMVALSRALIKRPDVIFLDEPLSSLDEPKRIELRSLVKASLTAVGTTALYVTHNLREALAIGDYLFILKDGAIVKSGPAQEVYESSIALLSAYGSLGD